MKTHANQVAAWGKLLGHCNALGASFNPSRESMKSTALTHLLNEAQKSIEAVHEAQNVLVNAINVRNRAFNDLPILGTRIIGALEAVGASPDHIADVNRIRARFRYQPPKETALKKNGSVGQAVPSAAFGRQAEQPNGVEVPPASTPRGPVSMLGFTGKTENLAELIGLLSKEPKYLPNEADLTIESLEAKLADLREKQNAVSIASMALYSARQLRKKLLFRAEGIYGTSVMVKKYIKSVFGFNSEQYQVISKIKFSR
jgi:hypothetical protein